MEKSPLYDFADGILKATALLAVCAYLRSAIASFYACNQTDGAGLFSVAASILVLFLGGLAVLIVLDASRQANENLAKRAPRLGSTLVRAQPILFIMFFLPAVYIVTEDFNARLSFSECQQEGDRSPRTSS
ncbi:hypothetical protein GI582_18240 [Sulfitobacter sp. BDSS02]|nr:hypothetical protein [Sulfitobacter sp. BDSS02]MBR9852070.1 hypothetical protein [Paracoccaceae bacterium]